MVFPPNPNRRWPYAPPPQQHPYYGHQFHQYRPSIIQQFRKPDGTLDYEKIINHGGQIMSIVNQARPLVKQMKPLLSLFKGK